MGVEMARAWGQCQAISHGLEMRFGNGVGISLKSCYFSAQMGCYSFLGKQEYELPFFSSKMGISFLETRIGATTIDSVWKDVEVEC